MTKKITKIKKKNNGWKKNTMPTEHYRHITVTDKAISQKRSLFEFPEEIVGKTDHGLRKYLVFYFDDDADYDLVLKHLELKGVKVHSHPALNTKKLVKILEDTDGKKRIR